MINRRQSFRGAFLGAGSLLFAPFIRQLDAVELERAPPLRVVFLVQGNGLYPDQVQPEGIERPSAPDVTVDQELSSHSFARSVSALEPVRDKVCFLHGLSGRIGLGNHGMGMGALGCFPSQKNVFMETVDAALARVLPAHFHHVGLGVDSAPDTAVLYNVSAWGKDRPIPTQCSPLLAHRTLFAIAAGATGRQRFDARTQLLDFLADDVRRMQLRLTAAEKAKLEHYLNALELMSHRSSALVRLQDRIAMAAPEADERFGRNSCAFDRLEAQFEIAAGALVSGLTRVVTISTGAGRDQTGVDFDGTELGLRAGPIPAHEVGHNQFVQGTNATELHIRTREQHCRRLVNFVRTLDSVPEGEGTIMDNTVIVYLSDAAESHHPQAREWPVIVIGNLGGRLRIGNRYLRLPWYGKSGHRTLAAFYMALLHAAGDRRKQFGLPDPELADLDQSGPLREILT